jgi:hypothetical protein
LLGLSLGAVGGELAFPKNSISGLSKGTCFTRGPKTSLILFLITSFINGEGLVDDISGLGHWIASSAHNGVKRFSFGDLRPAMQMDWTGSDREWK